MNFFDLVEKRRSVRKFSNENVPDEVVSAYGGDRPRYGKDYIIPSTFDPRLISVIPAAVAEAAMKSGVARKKISDLEIYKDQLTNRLDPTMSLMQGINAKVRKNPKRVIFAEGEDENMLKAAIEFGRNKLGTPILIGAEKRIKEQLKSIHQTDSLNNYVDQTVSVLIADVDELTSSPIYSIYTDINVPQENYLQ